MVGASIDPTAAIPEADLLDQHTPATPQSLTEPAGESSLAESLAPDAANLIDASEADLVEQAVALPEDEDEDEDYYPNTYDDPTRQE